MRNGRERRRKRKQWWWEVVCICDRWLEMRNKRQEMIGEKKDKGNGGEGHLYV